MRHCVMCGIDLSGRQTRHCSRLCASRSLNAARKADGRLREYSRRPDVRARRAATFRASRIEAVCRRCGETYDCSITHPEQLYCSKSCAAKDAPSRPRPGQRGPLRTAWDAQDWPTVQAALLARTERNLTGCANWVGYTNKDGYPEVTLDGKRRPAYRVMATAINGGSIGANPVHHVCANRACLAPLHLQVVRPHENTAEMLHRNWYLQRIADLEAALAVIDPSHPLLTTLPLAGVS